MALAIHHSESHFHSLTGTAAKWAVVLEIAAIYVLSTLPTPLYALYERDFGFSHLTLTLVYAAYVVGIVAAMFFFGRLSDQIGRRPVVLASLAVAAASALAFLFTASTGLLFPARILSGLAIALASGASTAWVIEVEPYHDKAAATRAAIAASLLGLGLWPLLAGVLAQWALWPHRLSYLSHCLLLRNLASRRRHRPSLQSRQPMDRRS